MKKLVIRHSPPLSGDILISGSKNAALPILAGCLLCGDTIRLSNLPHLTDVRVICEILRSLGCKIIRENKSTMLLDASDITGFAAPYGLAGKMRASFLIMGPMLARFGKIRISLPGGCPIGSRPVNLHLKGFAALGAEISQGHGYVELSAPRLTGTRLYLDFPSVGATENILMASVLADGVTMIENAAAEPEIVDLANFLCSMGAQITGAGTDTIRVQGVPHLHGTDYAIIPDRIEAGSFMIAAAMTQGDVTLRGVICDHLKPVTAKLREFGAQVTVGDDSVRVRATEVRSPLDIKTLPFPGFPTDLQAQMMALLSVTKGTSIITETIFENRFMHAAELRRMGADIKIEGRTAIVEGRNTLTGSEVCATDLRAGASLVLAGLAAKGCTTVAGVHHIERGYENLDQKLRALGADVEFSEIP